MPRRKAARDPIAVLSGGIVSKKTHGGRSDGAIVRQSFLPLPVDRTLELRFELDEGFSGDFEIPGEIAGARIKPVVFVHEADVEAVDRVALRSRLLELGAVYVKAPTIHVVRKTVHRDERHDAEISIEESLAIFAEETKPRDAAEKIAFAAELAREADAGARE